jgi:Insertion element 4 transposase N-terminal/Transposase DDE domain
MAYFQLPKTKIERSSGFHLMAYSLRQIDTELKFCQHLSFEAFQKVIASHHIQLALDQSIPAQTQTRTRLRRLSLEATVWLVIAMHLFATSSLSHVFQQLARGLRFIWPDSEYAWPSAGALSYRRYQLGPKPLVALFHAVCRPMATPQTKGAWLFGRRLMALDGTTEDVADTPANALAFGRHKTDRGQSAFPQLKGVYLVECGTHALVDAGFWPCHTSERRGGLRLLRSVSQGMLVMWDRGFHSFEMIKACLTRQADFLGRLPSTVTTRPRRYLPDGSYLAYLTPSDYHQRKQGERVLVRIVDYTITDPNMAGYGQRHRVVTSLLDCGGAPAKEVAAAYHERWEIEMVIDEVDTHQRLVGRPLRSLLPAGVIQELYGLLVAHYAIRFLMHQAALEANVDPDRLSFVHAIEVVRGAVSEFQMVCVDQIEPLYGRLLRDIAAVRLAERRLRTNPRVVKQKMSNFKLKRAEQQGYYRRDGCFANVIALI